MELYIEKCFLDKFNKEWNANSTSIGKTVLASILKTYGNVNWYIDYEIDSPEKLEQFNIEFSEISSHIFPPIPISSTIKEHFFEHSGCAQTIICTMHDQAWFGDAEKKGALCFCYENFENKLEKIIKTCDNLKVDLSEQFVGWEYFNQLKSIPKNKIVINDGYLFSKSGRNNPIEENFIPFLKNTLSTNSETKIEIFTDYLNNNQVNIDPISKKLYNVFKSEYKVNFTFVQFHFHDRIYYSNFFMVECGIGFNFNKYKRSNSKITVESIFDKFSYNRMNNHLKLLKKKKESSIIK